MPARYYILSPDKVPVPCTKSAWIAWLNTDVRTNRTARVGTETVTTLFTGVQTSADQPLFVTHVYGERCPGLTAVYPDYAAAMAGHEAMCQRVRQLLAPPPPRPPVATDDDA